MNKIRLLMLGTAICAAVLVSAAQPPVGGGYLDAGLRGEYFANTSLSGSPQFTRKDIRVCFDWGTLLPVGGSTAPALRDFPTDNFSIRWTGQLAPVFSETYTFKIVSDQGVRVYIKAASAGAWTTLIDHWTSPTQTTNTATFAMVANARYDIKIEYWDGTGAAVVKILWSSPSTPEEVIDAATITGAAAHIYGDTIFADALRTASTWGPKTWNRAGTYTALTSNDVDTLGWPARDANTTLNNMCTGRYLLVFKGIAKVWSRSRYFAARGRWFVGSTNYYEFLPEGVGYNAASNTTTAELVWPNEDSMKIEFTNTQRTAASALNTGLTDIRLMRPITYGSDQYHQPGMIVHRLFYDFLNNYAILREYFSLGEDEWSGRTLPGGDDHRGSFILRRADTGELEDRGCLEDFICMANELGRDLYLNVNGGGASTNYLAKLAQAIRYGTDGVNPYATATANPTYPPLNPNLRLYLEFKNEIWNYGGAASYSDAAYRSNTWEGQIINYDGRYNLGSYARWQALKTVEISQAFRSVFGDAAMNEKIRVYLFGQYDSSSVWFPIISFIDNYFNNADGRANVPDPHPVNYHLWGGGGALYYSSKNNRGSMTPEPFQNGSAEEPALAGGATSLRPNGYGWTFTGNAGVCNPRVPWTNATVQSLGALGNTLGATTWLGFKFTIGPKNLFVYQVGRYGAAGNSQQHSVRIYKADGTTAGVYGDVEGVTPTAAGQFAYGRARYVSASLQRYPRPFRLSSNTTYYALCQEYAAGDQYYGSNTVMNAGPGFSINGAVAYSGSGTNFVTTLAGSYGYGPVSFLYTDTPLSTAAGALGIPPYDTYKTNQCLFIGPTSSVSQVVSFPTAGTYAVSWVSAGSADLGGPQVIVFYDGAIVTTQSPSYYGFQIGSSTEFQVPSAGSHTIKLEARTGNNAVFMDDLRIGSADAFFGPNYENLPASGDAYGEVKTDWIKRSMTQVNFAKAWGLAASSYEGGWALGGDGVRTPFMDYLNYQAPQTAGAEEKALDTWSSMGGYEFQHHYVQLEDSYRNMVNATNFPLVKGAINYNRRLPVAHSTNGNVMACEVSSYDAHFMAGPYSHRSGGGNYGLDATTNSAYWWLAWNVIAPASANYLVKALTETGGTFRLLADESTLVANGTSGVAVTGTVYFTKGMHQVKLRALSGKFYVSNVWFCGLSQAFMKLCGAGQYITNGDSTPAVFDNTDFGTLPTGAYVESAFVITNVGLGALVLTGAAPIVISGPQASAFTVVQAPATSIAVGASATFRLRFSAALIGAHNAMASALVADSIPYTVAIAGTGVAPASQCVVSNSPLTVVEGGAAPLYVHLDAPPVADIMVTVAYESGDTSVKVNTNLTFTLQNWHTWQTGIVRADDDADRLSGTAVVRCSSPNLVTPTDVNVSVADNDELHIIALPSTVEMAKGGNSQFGVRLNVQPDGNTTVSISRTTGDADISVTAGSQLIFSITDWQAYQNVQLSAVQDGLATPDTAAILCMAPAVYPPVVSAVVNAVAWQDGNVFVYTNRVSGGHWTNQFNWDPNGIPNMPNCTAILTNYGPMAPNSSFSIVLPAAYAITVGVLRATEFPSNEFNLSGAGLVMKRAGGLPRIEAFKSSDYEGLKLPTKMEVVQDLIVSNTGASIWAAAADKWHGTNTIQKWGSGTMVIGGINTGFWGEVIVYQGTLGTRDTSGMPAVFTNAAIRCKNGAAFNVRDSITVFARLAFEAGASFQPASMGNDSNVYRGPVEIAGTVSWSGGAVSRGAWFYGDISGAGQISLSGAALTNWFIGSIAPGGTNVGKLTLARSSGFAMFGTATDPLILAIDIRGASGLPGVSHDQLVVSNLPADLLLDTIDLQINGTVATPATTNWILVALGANGIASTFHSVSYAGTPDVTVVYDYANKRAGIVAAGMVATPGDVTQFSATLAGGYACMVLSWSNNAVNILVCTNRSYTSKLSSWFELARGVSSPWTHQDASNYPVIFYRIVSGTYTSQYDVGKYTVTLAPGTGSDATYNWLSPPLELFSNTVGYVLGQQLNYDETYFDILKAQSAIGSDAQVDTYYFAGTWTDFDAEATRFEPGRGYMLVVDATHMQPKTVAFVGKVPDAAVTNVLSAPNGTDAVYNWIGAPSPALRGFFANGLTNPVVTTETDANFDLYKHQVTIGADAQKDWYYLNGLWDDFESGTPEQTPGMGGMLILDAIHTGADTTWAAPKTR